MMNEISNENGKGFIPVKPISEPQTRINIEGLGSCRDVLGKIKKKMVRVIKEKKSIVEVNPGESEFAKWRKGIRDV